MIILNILTMPSKDKKDELMITKYFRNLEKYQTMYGEKTLLLLQCGSFYEVYTPINELGEYMNNCFQDYLDITNMNAADSNKSFIDKEGIIKVDKLTNLNGYLSDAQKKYIDQNNN